MSEQREMRQRCESYNRIEIWSEANVWNEYMMRENSSNHIAVSLEIVKGEEIASRVSEERE